MILDKIIATIPVVDIQCDRCSAYYRDWHNAKDKPAGNMVPLPTRELLEEAKGAGWEIIYLHLKTFTFCPACKTL